MSTGPIPDSRDPSGLRESRDPHASNPALEASHRTATPERVSLGDHLFPPRHRAEARSRAGRARERLLLSIALADVSLSSGADSFDERLDGADEEDSPWSMLAHESCHEGSVQLLACAVGAP